jgi:cytochrome c peroxidase
MSSVLSKFVTTIFAVAALSSCTDETSFTAEERAILEEYRLPTKAPDDPSNQYASNDKAVAAAQLGKRIFFDRRFSGPLRPPNDGETNGSRGAVGLTGRLACSDCHDPADGGADRRSRPTATSLGATYTGRNAPTVINAAYAVASGGWQRWDGSKDSLWSQTLSPLEGPTEHNTTRAAVAALIDAEYKPAYTAVFGAPVLTAAGINRVFANVGKAIAAYERLLVSSNFNPAPFDQMLAGDDTAMTPAAVRGAKLFIGKAGCNECHRGPMFTDYRFHNIGVPQEGDFVLRTDRGRSDAISSLQSDDFRRSGDFGDEDATAKAKYQAYLDSLTVLPADVGAFKTPTLRNVSKTAPYMHNGVYSNIWDVVNHYNFGGGTGIFSGTKEVTIAPLLLDNAELGDLVEFLRSLDDGEALPYPELPGGLVAAPPGFTGTN